MNYKKVISLFIADDEKLLLDGFKEFLDNEEYENYSFTVTGIAQEGNELLFKMRENYFDVLILDLAMPGLSGLDILNHIKASKVYYKILFYSAFNNPMIVYKCKKLGARGFVHKNGNPYLIFPAVVDVYNNKKVFPDLSEVETELSNEDIFFTGFEYNEIKNILTKRELEIFLKFGDGETITEIEDHLFISRKCVEYHQTNIKYKLHLKNHTQLIGIASRFNLLFRKTNKIYSDPLLLKN